MIFSNFNFLDISANCPHIVSICRPRQNGRFMFFADPFPQAGDRGRQGLHGVKSPFSAKSGCPLRCRQIRPETPCLSLPVAVLAAPFPPAASQCPDDDITNAPPYGRCIPCARHCPPGSRPRSARFPLQRSRYRDCAAKSTQCRIGSHPNCSTPCLYRCAIVYKPRYSRLKSFAEYPYFIFQALTASRFIRMSHTLLG